MRNLFRSGTAFLIIAGFSFMAAAFTGVVYLVTGNSSVVIPVVTVANGVMMLVIGIVIRSKNAK